MDVFKYLKQVNNHIKEGAMMSFWGWNILMVSGRIPRQVK